MILIPEIPYDINVVTDVIKNVLRQERHSRSSLWQKELFLKKTQNLRKQYKAKLAQRKYPSIAYELAAEIEEKMDKVRVTVPGHTQRGGSPCAYDRVIATRVGAAASELILNKEYGYMIGIVNNETVKVPLSEVAGKLKMVDPKSRLVQEAKAIGISFGDK